MSTALSHVIRFTNTSYKQFRIKVQDLLINSPNQSESEKSESDEEENQEVQVRTRNRRNRPSRDSSIRTSKRRNPQLDSESDSEHDLNASDREEGSENEEESDREDEESDNANEESDQESWKEEIKTVLLSMNLTKRQEEKKIKEFINMGNRIYYNCSMVLVYIKLYIKVFCVLSIYIYYRYYRFEKDKDEAREKLRELNGSNSRRSSTIDRPRREARAPKRYLDSYDSEDSDVKENIVPPKRFKSTENERPTRRNSRRTSLKENSLFDDNAQDGIFNKRPTRQRRRPDRFSGESNSSKGLSYTEGNITVFYSFIYHLVSADSDEEEEIPTRSARPSRATRSQKFFESDDEDDPETSDFEP